MTCKHLQQLLDSMLRLIATCCKRLHMSVSSLRQFRQSRYRHQQPSTNESLSVVHQLSEIIIYTLFLRRCKHYNINLLLNFVNLLHGTSKNRINTHVPQSCQQQFYPPSAITQLNPTPSSPLTNLQVPQNFARSSRCFPSTTSPSQRHRFAKSTTT